MDRDNVAKIFGPGLDLDTGGTGTGFTLQIPSHKTQTRHITRCGCHEAETYTFFSLIDPGKFDKHFRLL